MQRNCWRKKTNTRRYRGLLARRMTVLRPASSEAPCTQQPTHVVRKVHAQARGTDKKICRRLSACTRASTKSRTRERNAIYAAAYFFMFFVVVVCFRAAISYCKALYMLVLWKIGKSVRPSVCHTCWLRRVKSQNGSTNHQTVLTISNQPQHKNVVTSFLHSTNWNLYFIFVLEVDKLTIVVMSSTPLKIIQDQLQNILETNVHHLRGSAIPTGPWPISFYKIRRGGACPRSVASRQTSRLWLLKCGVIGAEIAKIGIFW